MVPRVSRNVVSHPILLSFTSKPFLNTETFPLSFLTLTLCTSIKLYPGWIFRNNMVAVSPETDTYNLSRPFRWHNLWQRSYVPLPLPPTNSPIPLAYVRITKFSPDLIDCKRSTLVDLSPKASLIFWHLGTFETLASTQYTDGVTGALIVYPTDPAPKGFPSWDQELVVQLSDLYHTFSSELLAAYLSVCYFSWCCLLWEKLIISMNQPSGIDGTPGDEPVPDGGVCYNVFFHLTRVDNYYRQLTGLVNGIIAVITSRWVTQDRKFVPQPNIN